MIYDRRFGLPQSIADYLNQPLPDISGIFSLPQATEITQEDITETESPVGLTEEQLRLLYPQVRGEDGPRGGGLFGNLDLSRGKEVIRDVYQDVLGPPGAFEFSPQIMMAYPNLKSGLYQTYAGKNVDGLLSNTGATFGLAGLAMKMMGMQPKTVGGFVPGSIRGRFDTPADILKFISGANRREAQAKQQEALEKSAATKRNIQQYTGGGGGGFGGSRRGDADISDSQRGGFATDDTAGFF